MYRFFAEQEVDLGRTVNFFWNLGCSQRYCSSAQDS